MKSLFQTQLERFVAKRTAVCWLLGSVLVFIAFGGSRNLLLGLLSGAACGILSFCGNSLLLRQLEGRTAAFSGHKRRDPLGAVAFLLKQLLLFLFLFLAYHLEHRFFYGMVAGILLVPFVILLNAITEVLGITKNNFYI